MTIEKINELYAKATPGPWEVGPVYDSTPDFIEKKPSQKYASLDPQQCEDFDALLSRADVELIVSLHESWPRVARVLEAAIKVKQNAAHLDTDMSPIVIPIHSMWELSSALHDLGKSAEDQE